MHLVGYTINNGDISSMTPLQKMCVRLITNEILKWKLDNKPFIVI